MMKKNISGIAKFLSVPVFLLVFSVTLNFDNAWALTLGLKSCESGLSGVCESGSIPNSLSLRDFFLFQEGEYGFYGLGIAGTGGNDRNADALTLASTHGLVGFELQKLGNLTVSFTLINIYTTSTDLVTPMGLAPGGNPFPAGALPGVLSIEEFVYEGSSGGNPFPAGALPGVLSIEEFVYEGSSGGNPFSAGALPGILSIEEFVYEGSSGGNPFSAGALPGVLSIEEFVYEGSSGGMFHDEGGEINSIAGQIENMLNDNHGGTGERPVITPVPEPGTLLLLAGGLIGMIMFRKRQINQVRDF